MTKEVFLEKLSQEMGLDYIISEDTSIDDIGGGLDSLSIISIMGFFADELGIEITREKIKKCTNVANLCELARLKA